MIRTDPPITNFKKILLYATVFTLALIASTVHASELFEVTVERGVSAKMRDGVVLRADIYRPKAEGTFPVLLQRTPYNKSNGVTFGVRAAARGFVVIFQDVRGRYSSEGEWYTFKHESDDGYDSVEWAAALPYSNGKVGMFGGSYVGATQMLAAIAHPPHLAGICPVVTASNYHDGWTYQGGAFEQWFNESWTSGLAQDSFDRSVAQNTNARHGMWKLPLASYPLFNFFLIPRRGSTRPASLRPTSSTGSHTPTTTPIGSAGRSKNTTPTLTFQLSPWLPGTTFSRADLCEITRGSGRTEAMERALDNACSW
jgi:predicted acyl esterase